MIEAVIFDMWGVLINDDRSLVEGAIDVLEDLSENYVLGVATSIDRSAMIETLRELDIMQYFDSFSAGSDVEYNKPNPDVYIRTQELMGFDIEQCLVVEDSMINVKSVKDAGFKCVWKGFGKCDYADDCIEDILELSDVVDNIDMKL